MLRHFHHHSIRSPRCDRSDPRAPHLSVELTTWKTVSIFRNNRSFPQRTRVVSTVGGGWTSSQFHCLPHDFNNRDDISHGAYSIYSTRCCRRPPSRFSSSSCHRWATVFSPACWCRSVQITYVGNQTNRVLCANEYLPVVDGHLDAFLRTGEEVVSSYCYADASW